MAVAMDLRHHRPHEYPISKIYVKQIHCLDLCIVTKAYDISALNAVYCDNPTMILKTEDYHIIPKD